MLTQKYFKEFAAYEMTAGTVRRSAGVSALASSAKLFIFLVALALFFGAFINLAVAEDKKVDGSSARPLLDFSDPSYNGRYRELIGELRCPKCQNQNLADSDAPIAKDLRSELVRLLEEGKDDQAILNFMTLRYGDFVRYRPALSSYTLALWALPIAIFLLGVFVLLNMLRRRHATAQSEAEPMHKKEAASTQANSSDEQLLDERVKELVERAHAER